MNRTIPVVWGEKKVKLSKWFYISSFVLSTGLAVAVAVAIERGGRKYEILMSIPILYTSVVTLVFLYKIWAAIWDGHARTTPGQAIGFLFIPIVGYLWLILVFWGYYRDYNKYLIRHSIKIKELPKGLFLTHLLFTFAIFPGWLFVPKRFFDILAGPPILTIVFLDFLLGLYIVTKICDAVNALVETGSQQEVVSGK